MVLTLTPLTQDLPKDSSALFPGCGCVAVKHGDFLGGKLEADLGGAGGCHGLNRLRCVFALWLCAALWLGKAGNGTGYAVSSGLRQNFGPYVHGLHGPVSKGFCGFFGRPTQEVDCGFFVHAAIVNLVYDF
jgi:hypothetical protein